MINCSLLKTTNQRQR